MPVTLYLLALAVFVMGTSEFMLAGLLPAIALELDVSISTAGLLTSTFALGMVVGAPVMAVFARRWPARLTLTLCLLVFAGSHVIGAITSLFPLLLATRVFSALANAGFLAIALTTATALAPPNRKGRAVSVLLSGTTIATVAGVPAGALLGTAAGWRATFWAVALLCIPAAIGVLRGVPAPAGRRARIVAPAPPLRSEIRVLKTHRLILAMSAGALVNAGTFAAFTFIAPVVTGIAGLAELWVPVALVLFGVGSFAGVTIAGRLADRRPGVALFLGGPLLLGGWLAAGCFAAQPVALMALILVLGFLSFGVGSTLIARVLYAAGDAPTMAGAYGTSALNIGAAVGPASAAAVLAAGASPTAPFGVAAAFTGAALVAMAAFPRLFIRNDATP